MPNPALISEKISEVIIELKNQHLWSNAPPAWVGCFKENKACENREFIAWLQFVYLPNIVQICHGSPASGEIFYVAPQAIKSLGSSVVYERLLRLLVELDSLL